MRSAALVERLRRRLRRDGLAQDVVAAARSTHASVWLVGGSVRDAALGRASRDLDLVAGPHTLRLVRRLEQAWGRRAFRFRKRGVTTWRFAVSERRVDLVALGRRALEADLLRRELTINAIALDMLGSRLVDPAGGLADLRARRLRMPRAGVFREDPVRAVRLARFLSQLASFRLDRSTSGEAASVAHRVRRAPVERVSVELERLLLGAAPDSGLETLQRLGLVEVLLPELTPLHDCVAGRDRPDVWRHTLDALAVAARAGRLPGAKAVRDEEARIVLFWALLLHDVAKPDTLAYRDDGRPTFHGHERLGAERADALLRRLRLPKGRRRRVVRVIELHLRPSQLAESGATARGIRRLAREAGEDLPVLVLHAACDARASGGPEVPGRWRRLARVLRVLLEAGESARIAPRPPLVDGRDVMRAAGLASGPEVGRLLDRVRELQDEGELTAREEALDWLREQARAGPPSGDRGRGQ